MFCHLIKFLERLKAFLNKRKNSKILYKELESKLIKLIKNENYLPGQKFLSDRNIAHTFKVSRSTANRAISDMVDRNLLFRVQGKGTFIVAKKSKYSKFAFSGSNSLTDALKDSGKQVSTKIIHFYEDCSTNFFLKKLNLNDQEKIVGIQRERFADLAPFAVENTYVPEKYFSDFLATDFNYISLYDYMESKGHKPVSFQQYITVIEPNKRIQKLLNLEDDQYIFKINFTTADTMGNIVEYTESYMNLYDMEMTYEVNFNH